MDCSTPGFPCPSPSPGACSNSCWLSQWCHLTISSSVNPFSSCLQSFLAAESFLMSQLFASDGQSIEASASASVLQWIVRVHPYCTLKGPLWQVTPQPTPFQPHWPSGCFSSIMSLSYINKFHYCLFFFLNWGIGVWQCCRAKWISYMYTYIPLPSGSLSLLPHHTHPGHHITPSWASWLHSSFLLATCLIHSSVDLSISIA